MYKLLGLILSLSILLPACNITTSDDHSDPTSPPNIDIVGPESVSIEATSTALEQMAVPNLPFPDNADPAECGIPQPWGTNNNQAWLNGYWEGDLIQPMVYLYDSHGRNIVTAAAPHGTEVQVLLFQSNPTLNFYLVKIPSLPSGINEGWIPEPFLSFEPIEVNQSFG